MQQPRLLYRFMDERWGLESIVFRRFRISRFAELNDPFEMYFSIIDDDLNDPAITQKLAAVSAETANELFGVICYSATASQPVLWAHYANNHQGMAFEVQHSPLVRNLEEVRYTDKRVVLDLAGAVTNDEVTARVLPLARELRSQKSLGWSYEEEHRSFHPLERLNPVNGHYFISIAPEFLKRVILGMKCRFSEDQIGGALKAAGLGSTSVVRAQRCDATYKVLF